MDTEIRKILLRGHRIWNRWRAQNPDAELTLIGGNLRGKNLSQCNLSNFDLQSADLKGAILRDCDLSYALLRSADLSDADLRGANLHQASLQKALCVRADLRGASLQQAKLYRADLSWAKAHGTTFVEADLGGGRLRATILRRANLCRADLRDTDLTEADLTGANVDGADIGRATVGWTTFGLIRLSDLRGLETVSHTGPSTVGIDAIYASKGKLPEDFLRGAGVSPRFISYMDSSVRGNVEEFHSCFISYSSKDTSFAEHLHSDLQKRGVRCWFAPEAMKTGDEVRQSIHDAIRSYDKLLLILSASSIESAWANDEVEAAFDRERQHQEQQEDAHFMLFPIRIDDAVRESTRAWAASIQRSRHITDFTDWEKPERYQEAFQRLLQDLRQTDD